MTVLLPGLLLWPGFGLAMSKETVLPALPALQVRSTMPGHFLKPLAKASTLLQTGWKSCSDEGPPPEGPTRPTDCPAEMLKEIPLST